MRKTTLEIDVSAKLTNRHRRHGSKSVALIALTLGAVACEEPDVMAGPTGDAAGAAAEVDGGGTHDHSGHTHAPPTPSPQMPDDSDASEQALLFDWELPPGFPVPRVPEDNPVTPAKVELGRHLFYDERLSGNGTQSCGSCHEQARAFTDARAVGVGSTGEAHVRGAMSLGNVGYASSFTWANATLGSLEDQALVPLFGESPIELGLTGQLSSLIDTLGKDDRYPAMFKQAFPEADVPISLQTLVKAIASFERALVSGRSPYDRYIYDGEEDALSEPQKRGMELFFSERLECFHCHGGFAFAGSVTHADKAFDETTFHNNGLYNLDGKGAYPEDNTGLYAFTGEARDMGRFKAPTLRNIEKTAPYMHDGSIATLSEVLDHYAAGGRNVTHGPYVGDGRLSPFKSELVPGFELSAEEKSDVLEFLNSLTDEAFLNDPRYADPDPMPP